LAPRHGGRNGLGRRNRLPPMGDHSIDLLALDTAQNSDHDPDRHNG
jgi:hypothetical protein